MNNNKLRMSPFCDKYPMNLTDLVRVLCVCVCLWYFICMLFILSVSVSLAFINIGLLRKNRGGLQFEGTTTP